jgi:hypothetical protein
MSLLSPAESAAVELASPLGLVDGSVLAASVLAWSPLPDGCSVGPLEEVLGCGLVVPVGVVGEGSTGLVVGPLVLAGAGEVGATGSGAGALGPVVVEGDGSGGGVLLLLEEAEQLAAVINKPVSKTLVRIVAPTRARWADAPVP